MKHRITLLTVCFIFISLTVYAGDKIDTDETYIVKCNNPAQAINEGETGCHNSRNYCTMSGTELQKYLAVGAVDYYEPDCEILLFEDYNNPSVSYDQWNLSAINIKKAWDIGCYGNDVKVAVIDSGIIEHPDLKGNILTGHNYTSNSTDTTDNIGHGTYISGIIAAECNDKYITGIAPQVKIIPLKCFDIEVETKASMIADAIYDAVDIYGCDVINMSFGMNEVLTNRTLQLSVAYAIQNGCIVVAAAGNDGSTIEYYPAKYDGVVGVGSIDENRRVSWFSQRNETVDVVAPGEAIQSVSIDGYDNNSGTSFSAPHVTAAAAIAKCIDSSLTTEQFMQLLESTSSKCEADLQDGYDIEYGYGLINVKNIVDEMLKEIPVFISPVTKQEIKIYNNSNKILVAHGIVASYDKNTMVNVNLCHIELPVNEIQGIKLAPQGALTKVMLWNSLENLTPLCRVKEYKTN